MKNKILASLSMFLISGAAFAEYQKLFLFQPININL